MSRESSYRIRPAGRQDLAAAVALNQIDLPHLSALSPSSLGQLALLSSYFRVAESEGDLAGFLIAMAPEAPYQSVNFLWFKTRYPSFLYIDRVVVARPLRREGIASRLYQDLEDHAVTSGVALLCCEVNQRPPNPESLAFHIRHGFTEVGTQDTEQGTKTVSLQIKQL